MEIEDIAMVLKEIIVMQISLQTMNEIQNATQLTAVMTTVPVCAPECTQIMLEDEVC